MQMESILDYGYLRLPQVLEIIPVGRSTWWKGVAEGRFPRGVKLGPKTTVWAKKDIRDLSNRVYAGA